MWRKTRLLLILLLVNLIHSCDDREQMVDQRTLSNYDFRLFQSTPAWELAKAVEDGKEKEIIGIIKDNPELVNVQSPIYGVTVLHLAVSHHNLKSVECLLKSNADVNIQDKENGDTPLNKACFGSWGGKSLNIMKLLIKYGANINVTEVSDSCKMPDSPLMTACFDGFEEAVEFLISQDANINYIKNGEFTALGESLMVEHYKIAYYLLLHGADYTLPIHHVKEYKDGNLEIVRSVYITEELEGMNIGYFTPEREYYYKIVDFLKKKGIKIKESGKRKFNLSTFIDEIITLR